MSPVTELCGIRTSFCSFCEFEKNLSHASGSVSCSSWASLRSSVVFSSGMSTRLILVSQGCLSPFLYFSCLSQWVPVLVLSPGSWRFYSSGHLIRSDVKNRSVISVSELCCVPTMLGSTEDRRLISILLSGGGLYRRRLLYSVGGTELCSAASLADASFFLAGSSLTAP